MRRMRRKTRSQAVSSKQLIWWKRYCRAIWAWEKRFKSSQSWSMNKIKRFTNYRMRMRIWENVFRCLRISLARMETLKCRNWWEIRKFLSKESCNWKQQIRIGCKGSNLCLNPPSLSMLVKLIRIRSLWGPWWQVRVVSPLQSPISNQIVVLRTLISKERQIVKSSEAVDKWPTSKDRAKTVEIFNSIVILKAPNKIVWIKAQLWRLTEARKDKAIVCNLPAQMIIIFTQVLKNTRNNNLEANNINKSDRMSLPHRVKLVKTKRNRFRTNWGKAMGIWVGKADNLNNKWMNISSKIAVVMEQKLRIISIIHRIQWAHKPSFRINLQGRACMERQQSI